jgi:Tol biopolymer transport system component
VYRAWYPSSETEERRYARQIAAGYIEAVPLDLWVMDADGGNKRRLTTSRGEVNWAPSWHPDGQRIVFASNRDDWREELAAHGHNFELYLLELESGAITRLTVNATFDSFPIFSPDGSRLVFASNRDAKNPRSTNVYIADFVE